MTSRYRFTVLLSGESLLIKDFLFLYEIRVGTGFELFLEAMVDFELNVICSGGRL